jgi:uncharacterized protein (DUF305 family)
MQMPERSHIKRRCFISAAAVSVAAIVLAAVAELPARSEPSETAFISAMNTAMTTMMAKMQIQPSHDVDRDFVNMMVPHHSGAIEMAEAELRYGRNEKTRRLAQEIIVTQQEEIAALRLSVGESLPTSAPAPDQTASRKER